MNWSAAAAIISLLGILVTIIGVAYIAGQLSQKIQDGADRADEHKSILDRHDAKLGEHDVDIGRLHEWKNGFNAGSKAGSHRSD